MNNKEGRICRLCLQMPNSDFKPVDEVTKDILNTVLLKVNLALSEDPIVCKACADSLQKSFHFKSACMSAEDCLTFFDVAKSGATLDLNEVYLCESTNTNTAADADCSVCRFCLQRAKRGRYTPLEALERAMGIVSDMLPKYLPEINLKLTKEPVICTPCLASLESHFSFAMVCWNVEENIKKYLEIEGNGEGRIKLYDVLQFVLINTLDDEEYNQADEVRKERNLFINRDEEKVTEDFLPKLDVKDEGMAENLQETNPNSFQSETAYCELTDVKFKYEDNQELVHEGLPEAITYKSETHLSTKHDPPPEIPVYRCKVCPHQTRKKPDAPPIQQTDPYKCDVCTYQTRRKYRLKDHMVTHMDPSEAPMYRCEVCAFKTKQKFCLRRHMQLHKDSPSAPKFKCELCEFESRKKTCLEKHLQVHKDASQAKMYKCDNCSYAAKRRSRLKDHMLIHKDPSELSMFKCDMCSFQTKKKFSLKRHLLIHERSDGTVYTCKSCPFESRNRSDVKRHTLTHKNC